MSASKITPKDIAWLWVNMTRAFGFKFVSSFGEKDKGIWFEALHDLTKEDLVYGFRKMLMTISDSERSKGEVWPPNVKEFRLYCERRNSDFGLPTVHRAFIEAEKNKWFSRPVWSHPLVCLASQMFDQEQDVHRGVLFENFKKIYEQLVDRYMRGDLISLPKCYSHRSAIDVKQSQSHRLESFN